MYRQYQESGTILPFLLALTIRVTGMQHVMNHVLLQALHQGLRSATDEGAFQTLHELIPETKRALLTLSQLCHMILSRKPLLLPIRIAIETKSFHPLLHV
jgi:hypothetical protein